MRQREAPIEKSFVRVLKRHGLTTLKLNVSGQRGYPDRLVLLSGGRAVFVEFKRPGGKLTPLQEFTHDKLKALGFQVATFADAVEAVAWVRRQQDRLPAALHLQRDRAARRDRGVWWGRDRSARDGEGGALPPVRRVDP
jgi:Holliday junction resolvase-like predicted endonuclease